MSKGKAGAGKLKKHYAAEMLLHSVFKKTLCFI